MKRIIILTMALFLALSSYGQLKECTVTIDISTLTDATKDSVIVWSDLIPHWQSCEGSLVTWKIEAIAAARICADATFTPGAIDDNGEFIPFYSADIPYTLTASDSTQGNSGVFQLTKPWFINIMPFEQPAMRIYAGTCITSGSNVTLKMKEIPY